MAKSFTKLITHRRFILPGFFCRVDNLLIPSQVTNSSTQKPARRQHFLMSSSPSSTPLIMICSHLLKLMSPNLRSGWKNDFKNITFHGQVWYKHWLHGYTIHMQSEQDVNNITIPWLRLKQLVSAHRITNVTIMLCWSTCCFGWANRQLNMSTNKHRYDCVADKPIYSQMHANAYKYPYAKTVE